MPDKIVNHFVLADGSVARYSVDGLSGEIVDSYAREQIENTTSYRDLYNGLSDGGINETTHVWFENNYQKSAILKPYTGTTIDISVIVKNGVSNGNRFIVYGGNNGTFTRIYSVPNANLTGTETYTITDNQYDTVVVTVWYGTTYTADLDISALEYKGLTLPEFSVNNIPVFTKEEAKEYADNTVENTQDIYVETVNKNLFNVGTVTEDYSVSSSDGQLAPFPGYNTSDFIPIEPNTSYTFSTRHTVAFYNQFKRYISGSPSSARQTTTLTSPANASYLRFAYDVNNSSELRVNKGSTLLPYEPYGGIIKEEHLPDISVEIEKNYRLVCDTIKNFKGFSNRTSNYCLIGSKLIYGDVPEYDGFLLLDETTNKLYYADGQLEEITYLCDWNMTLSNNVVCADYLATITADGDIIFLRKWKRENPIIYPHGDYANPFVVDFGSSLKPYGFLTGVSCVQFSDGSFVFGDYAKHSLENEQNNDPRNIWRVVKPYNNPSNWTVAHSFKHVFYESPVSDEPDNEIGHIHTVSYDFYNDDLYCTTGDIDRHCRVWKSTDKGVTWSEVVSNGQKYRSVGLVFNEQGCYYGTDSFYSHHNLWLAPRLQTGECDFSNLEKIISLEPTGRNGSQATYGTILLKEPNGLLFMDRAEPREDNLLDIPFYSFDDEKLYFIATYKKVIFGTVEPNRNGLCNQFFTEYQPTTTDFVLTGGGSIVRPNTDDILNNSSDNYIGLIKMRVVLD